MGLEQKIDKLMVMMGKLVTKDKGQNSLNCKSINPTEIKDRQDILMNREDFRTGLGQTTTGPIHTEEGQDTDKIIKVGQDTILIIEVITAIIWEVTQGIGDKIITEMHSEVTLEVKAMKETEVGHVIGKLETITEGTIEVLVTVGQGQVQEQVQRVIGLGVSNVKSTTILQETVQQH